MKKYELAVLLHPDLEIDLEAPLKRLDDTLGGVEAKVEKRDNWGKRKLAYTINGQDFAVYLFFVIEVDPAKVSDLEASLRLNEEVLRHMLVNFEEMEEDEEKSEDKEESKKSESSDEKPKRVTKDKKE